MEKNQIIIKCDILFNGLIKSEDLNIVIENDKIIDIINGNLKYDYSGIVTPAFIDAHSHIGMERQGEPFYESEVNDNFDHLTPLFNPINSIYFDDRAFQEACDFGFLYSCVVPGSGNLIGGKAMIIKNFSENRKNCLLKDYGYKMALGYNPRSTTEWKGSRPKTRMGIYSLLEKKFEEIVNKEKKNFLSMEKKLEELNNKLKENKISESEKKYQEDIIKKEFNLEFNSEDKAFIEMLNGEKTIKVHCHKEDDILFLIELSKKFNLKITVEHLCDVFHQEIFDELATNNIYAVYGPIGGLDYKVELKHNSYKNINKLLRSKLFFGLMSDHPVVLTHNLKESLKYFLIAGMSEEEAISLLTYKNAKILGIDHILGTIEIGKIASLIVWDKNPFYLGSYPKLVIAEGRIIRNNFE